MTMRKPARWYHGGCPGLKPGDILLPPSATGTAVTGAAATMRILLEGAPGGAAHLRHLNPQPGRVYCGTRRQAFEFAALWTISPFCPGLGAVYRVSGDMARVPGRPAERDAPQLAVTGVETPAVGWPWIDANVPEARAVKSLLDAAYAKGRVRVSAQ